MLGAIVQKDISIAGRFWAQKDGDGEEPTDTDDLHNVDNIVETNAERHMEKGEDGYTKVLSRLQIKKLKKQQKGKDKPVVVRNTRSKAGLSSMPK